VLRDGDSLDALHVHNGHVLVVAAHGTRVLSFDGASGALRFEAVLSTTPDPMDDSPAPKAR
jgi:hypothetical protein